MKDALGDRIKRYYEDALRVTLPRRSYVVIRIDGRAFHTFTKKLARPYDQPLADALDRAAIDTCAEIEGCRFAYGQSDEYSFLLTDFDSEHSKMWFDGNVQKMVSVSASLFTAAFARVYERPGVFDARLLLIPQRAEVEKYFVWRQLDASANSLNMLASAHYSHAELAGQSESEKHDLLHAKGVNWAKCAADFKRGRVVHRDPPGRGWVVDREIPVFTRDKEYLRKLIPES